MIYQQNAPSIVNKYLIDFFKEFYLHPLLYSILKFSWQTFSIRKGRFELQETSFLSEVNWKNFRIRISAQSASLQEI